MSKPTIHFSPYARRVIIHTPQPIHIMQRMFSDHRSNAMQRCLPTRRGELPIRLSFHRMWYDKAMRNLVMVQHIKGQKLAVYTEDEFKAILRESLKFRVLQPQQMAV